MLALDPLRRRPAGRESTGVRVEACAMGGASEGTSDAARAWSEVVSDIIRHGRSCRIPTAIRDLHSALPIAGAKITVSRDLMRGSPKPMNGKAGGAGSHGTIRAHAAHR